MTSLGSRVDTLETANTTSTSNISSLTSRTSDLESETREQNVIRVASLGGDYTSLSTAIAAIQDASINNPYLITVGPGTFSLSATVTIPASVTVSGAGMYATKITSSVSNASTPSACAFVLSAGASMSNLSIETTATSTVTVAVCAESITAADSSNPATFTTYLDRVYLKDTATGGNNHYGIYSTDGDKRVTNSVISVGNASTNVGIAGIGTSSTHVLRIENSAIRATSGLAK